MNRNYIVNIVLSLALSAVTFGITNLLTSNAIFIHKSGLLSCMIVTTILTLTTKNKSRTTLFTIAILSGILFSLTYTYFIPLY